MPLEVSAQLKKRQAELLFDDFINIRTLKNITTKEGGFEGDAVVSDTAKRFSGTFSRQARSLQSRAPDQDVFLSEDAACAPSSAGVSGAPTECIESCPGAPSEECIHKVAEELSQVADQMDSDYANQNRGLQVKLLKELRVMGSNVPYDVFENLLSETISQDRDFSTFCFVLQLSSHATVQLGWSLSYFKQYVSEQFADVAAKCIDEQHLKD